MPPQNNTPGRIDFAEGYSIQWDLEGLRIETTDYNPCPLRLPWSMLRELMEQTSTATSADPLREAATQSTQIPLVNNPLDRGILIVDDESEFVLLLKELLRSKGYSRIYTASDGVEALSLMSGEACEAYLILLDLNMPRLNGLKFIERLRHSQRYPVGVMLLTGTFTLKLEDRFYTLGNETVMTLDYMTKPARTCRLTIKLKRYLDYVHLKRLVASQKLP